jgi:hypothetical protein
MHVFQKDEVFSINADNFSIYIKMRLQRCNETSFLLRVEVIILTGSWDVWIIFSRVKEHQAFHPFGLNINIKHNNNQEYLFSLVVGPLGNFYVYFRLRENHKKAVSI